VEISDGDRLLLSTNPNIDAITHSRLDAHLRLIDLTTGDVVRDAVRYSAGERLELADLSSNTVYALEVVGLNGQKLGATSLTSVARLPARRTVNLIRDKKVWATANQNELRARLTGPNERMQSRKGVIVQKAKLSIGSDWAKAVAKGGVRAQLALGLPPRSNGKLVFRDPAGWVLVSRELQAGKLRLNSGVLSVSEPVPPRTKSIEIWLERASNAKRWFANTPELRLADYSRGE
ncbi:hypothetical protein WDZ92_37020, partial [Nostoc sp. NIES-2111]